MATRKAARAVWTQELEQNLIELWQEHECLFDISHDMYHDRVEKERRWREVADALQQPVEEVKTRAVSLRTQYSRLIKPKPSGSDSKPLTPRQKWLLRAMDFLKKYIVHRPCETTLDVTFGEQEDAEDKDDPYETLSGPCTPPAAFPPEWTYEGASSSPSPTSTAGRAAPGEPRARGVKRKGKSDNDIELMKLAFLKQMAARIDADPAPDAFTAFGNQVAAELRQIEDPSYLTRLKRNIMNMIYDTQDTERSGGSSSSSSSSSSRAPPPAPHTCQPISSSPPTIPHRYATT